MPRNTRTEAIRRKRARALDVPVDEQTGMRITHLTRRHIRTLAIHTVAIGGGE
ncbi:MAG: hypothetical protein JO362_21810 [Streptomycetaceae bacterium]|nr:hypothetical protein [Streptomycetaceae bacterium]